MHTRRRRQPIRRRLATEPNLISSIQDAMNALEESIELAKELDLPEDAELLGKAYDAAYDVWAELS